MAEYKSNPSFILNGIDNTSFGEKPVPEVGPNDVLVEVKKTGLCGSDVHYLVHGRIGDYVVKDPMVLGHESAGVVYKVGSAVKTHKVGTRVALEPGASCRACEPCKAGRYNLCEHMVFAATPPYDGTLARYYKVPADLAYPLPDSVTLEEGAMMEPLSVGTHSVNTLGSFKYGQSIAVYGAGPVGLLCMAVAKALGAKRIFAIDIVASRLEFAKKYVGAETFLPEGRPPSGPDVTTEQRVNWARDKVEEMKQALGIDSRGPTAVDLVIEASGAEACVQMGLYLVKFGGTFVQVGMGAPNATVPLHLFLTKELTVKGSFRYGAGDYPLSISLVASGKVDVKPLITHTFKFEDALEAFETNKKGKSADGKAVIKAIINGPE